MHDTDMYRNSSMVKYSALKLFLEGLRGHRGWSPVWRTPEPKSRYDVIVIGGGGHGLATAYYLAREHGVSNVGVLERGWVGGGNTGGNTTVIRSNYYYPASARLYAFSLRKYVTPARELKRKSVFRQCG